VRHLRDPAAVKDAVVTFAVIAVGMAVLGAVAGLVWSHVAPPTAYVLTRDFGPVPADPETQTLIEADGWYTMLTGGLGLVAGILAFVLARRQLAVAAVGLAVGGLWASLLAQRVGESTSGAVQAAGPNGFTTVSTLGLTATAAVIVCPLLAVGSVWFFEFAIAYRGNQQVRLRPVITAGGAYSRAPLLSRRRGRHVRRRRRPTDGR
jgi:hypothetical protein